VDAVGSKRMTVVPQARELLAPIHRGLEQRLLDVALRART